MRYKIITYILFLLFALGLIGTASIVSAQARPASTYTAYVVRIIDGDTIHVRDITGEAAPHPPCYDRCTGKGAALWHGINKKIKRAVTPRHSPLES